MPRNPGRHRRHRKSLIVEGIDTAAAPPLPARRPDMPIVPSVTSDPYVKAMRTEVDRLVRAGEEILVNPDRFSQEEKASAAAACRRFLFSIGAELPPTKTQRTVAASYGLFTPPARVLHSRSQD